MERKLLRRFYIDALSVKVFADRKAMGAEAAMDCARAIRKVLERQRICRMIFAAAPSQNELLADLARADGVDWSKVHAFHMDEYIGLPDDASQRFGIFLRDRIFGHLPFGKVEYLAANAGMDAKTIDDEIQRYSMLIQQAMIDIVCLGIGENGHIAFNDPGVADFDDSVTVKEVVLDEKCRMQQVHDGCFTDFDAVPKKALSLTIPALMSGGRLFCVVPGAMKAQAVHDMLKGPVTELCPASILRRHHDCTLYLDADSAGKIP